MAVIRPFRGVRPVKEAAARVISLPYDVMNREEAARMAAGNPDSFLHISRAEIGLPEETNPYAQEVYEKGRNNLAEFIRRGVLFREEKPVLYLYRQVMKGRVQTGIVACVSVDEYLSDTIKKHELTRVEKEIDRINHFDVCNANTEPVFLTYREDKRIRAITEGIAAHREPEYDVTGADGIRHILWSVSEDRDIESLVRLFGEIPALYIADGHHRSASACKVSQKRREKTPGYSGNEEFNFFMAVIFPDNDLAVFDYNRVVKDLAGNSEEQFLGKVREAGFLVEEKGTEIYTPESKHDFGMFLTGKWYKLTAKPEIVPQDVIGSLDVSILQDRVLGPILEIGDPRTDKRIDFIGGIRGLSELERRVNLDMEVAFAVYPVRIADLIAVSDAGMIMPPKSTWFEPKLGSGLFVHEL